MSVFWTYADIKRNAFGVILVGALFAVMVPSALNKWADDASPVRSVEAIDAAIKSVQWGKGHGTVYVLFLENGSPVLIDDDRPHLIGSRVSIERVTRDSGSVSYRFAD
ncbi:hypothetical protein OHD62_12285 [Mesorhizobium sp. YC-39]|uniref:hypothetical protein n=1 Tax=unclassified Mesorhizobium TaxID=325217 RepID=UPI0021E76E8A|nr:MULTISPECIES: hypothetical protein [unclassified Mesorhizobium]MCV3207419.1 hypothetical protein [Mesorhizobium sp. YC-2]MCV3229146.1 hypothetical protein [Mesorhizobium sp. YC-39]